MFFRTSRELFRWFACLRPYCGHHAALDSATQSKKGQLLLRVRSDDISGGFDAYRKAVSDGLLARKQVDRAKLLYEHGAIALGDLEVAQDYSEDDAKTYPPLRE